MIPADPILRRLTEHQKALFNQDAPEVERVKVYEEIKRRQREIGGKE